MCTFACAATSDLFKRQSRKLLGLRITAPKDSGADRLDLTQSWLVPS